MKLPLIALLASSLSAAAQVTFLDPAAAALVAQDAKVVTLGSGMKFTEGPVWIPARQTLVFSDIPSAKLMQWQEGKGVTPLSDALNPNGNTLDRNGLLVTCQHSGRNIIRTEANGTTTVLVSSFDGKKLSSPNDVIVAKDGIVWFTDPPYGVPAGEKKEQDANRVYRLDPATKKVTAVSSLFEMPNGLAFSPDERTLYIADSGKPQRVGAFPVKGDGSLGDPKFWLSSDTASALYEMVPAKLQTPVLANASGTYTYTAFPTTLGASNPNRDGISKIEYKIGTGNWTAYTSPVALTHDHSVGVSSRAVPLDSRFWLNSDTASAT